jgi:hypothetical protein
VFHNRGDWAEYTRQTTGTNAAVYLQIGRGGYTVSDRFAIYRATPDAAYMVAAHEGWHQYVARHWAQRLPPALEEGLACVFESLRVEQGIPQWTLTRNVNRLGALRWALETDELWPLDELIGMHAGQVVALPPQRVELFYGQCWALARMLLEEGEWAGETAPLPRLVADAAAGRLEGLTGASVRGRQRAQARPLLERYTGRSLEQLQAQYDRYVRELVQD